MTNEGPPEAAKQHSGEPQDAERTTIWSTAEPLVSYTFSTPAPPEKPAWRDHITLTIAVVAFAFSLYNFVFETLRGADLRFGEQKSVGLLFETCDSNYVRAWIDLQFVNVGGPKSAIFLRPRWADVEYGDQAIRLAYHFATRTERYHGSEAHCQSLADGSRVYAKSDEKIVVGKREFSTIFVLDPGKPLLTEMFFSPDSSKDIRSLDDVLAQLKPNSQIKISFSFDYSENFDVLTWIGWQGESKNASVSCSIKAKDDVIAKFKKNQFFSVGSNYATCATKDLKRIFASQ